MPSDPTAYQWLLFAGFFHLAVFPMLYGWWAFRRGLVDDVTQARLSFASGVGLGLFVGGILVRATTTVPELPAVMRSTGTLWSG